MSDDEGLPDGEGVPVSELSSEGETAADGEGAPEGEGTPERESIHSRIASRAASRPPGVFWGSLALVVLIVAMFGFGLGYALEHKDAKTTAKRAATVPKKKAAATKKKAAAPATAVTTGKVTGTTLKTITVKTANGKTQRITVEPGTVVLKASKGAAGDVKKDVRMIYKPKSLSEAKEVLVLPAKGSLGTKLTGATSTSMTFKGPGGKSVTVKTGKAAIDKTAAAKLADVKKDATIVVHARRNSKGQMVATEIVLLPSGSAFV